MPKQSVSAKKHFIPSKIISGGQTGVDRAGLDAAIFAKIEIGGYVPKGRLSEDGRVPEKYLMTETPSDDYPQRTILNVKSSDATLILYREKFNGGTKFTYECCIENNKPVFCVDIFSESLLCNEMIISFLKQHKPAVLNIAGPRESNSPGIYDAALKILKSVFNGR